jgi:hypothetical protein
MYSNQQIMAASGQLFAFSVVSGSTIVAGTQEEVRKVLQRNAKPTLTPSLQGAMKQTDFSATVAFAMGKIPWELRQKMDQDLKKLGNLQMITAGLDKTEGGTLEIRIGSDIRLKSLTIYSDAKTAQEMEKSAKSMMSFIQLLGPPPAVSDLLKPIKFQADGSTLISTMTIDVDKVIKMIEDQWLLRRF